MSTNNMLIKEIWAPYLVGSAGLVLCCKSQRTGGRRGSCTSCNQCRILSSNFQRIHLHPGTGTGRHWAASRTRWSWESSSREWLQRRDCSSQNPWRWTRVKWEIPETDDALWRVEKSSGSLQVLHSGSSGRILQSYFEKERADLFYLISKKRGSLTPKYSENYTDIVERLSGRRALVKTTANPTVKTWLNPKSRSYALQGGSGSIGQGAHRNSYTQFTQPAFL